MEHSHPDKNIGEPWNFVSAQPKACLCSKPFSMISQKINRTCQLETLFLAVSKTCFFFCFSSSLWTSFSHPISLYLILLPTFSQLCMFSYVLILTQVLFSGFCIFSNSFVNHSQILKSSSRVLSEFESILSPLWCLENAVIWLLYFLSFKYVVL